jgi:redox-sensitive bicupin YhaK (pirin superfamily)
MAMKKILDVQDAPRPHWVGDGFPVRSLFSYHTHAEQLSPFLLLDYAGPARFTPTAKRRGVGQHPHRGFETVTIVYQGEVAHGDSTGQGGVIGPGDVQWMTAGAGILHEEFHSDTFSREGGTFEVVQLWVNLPAKDKTAPPRYQEILDKDIPAVALPDEAGTLRIIAGRHAGRSGPASTFTPMHVWDMRLNPGGIADLAVPEGWNTALVVLRGTVLVNDEAIVRDAQLALLDPAGTNLSIAANNDAAVLLLSGQPIAEPIAGYGPFVMNSEDQIRAAIADFNNGRFGEMPAK